MERIDIPLSQLTFAQKLDLMETIWGDLAREEKTLESPAWHEAVLSDRKKALSAGKSTVSDWEEAKDRIRKNISEAFTV
ncbi:MAG: addiction module protein [Desulfobacteraceae bacterium]|nr:addiction module protein [Desulfobacteraceae bacterium]